ncbi:MAG: transmembrane domain-containing protein [Desulfofustis sp.]|nr:transmembrane domain-containing protein [Desulfofustis sp.]
MRKRVVLFLLIFFLIGYNQASAHRVQVFAAAEEGLIKGEATLSGRHPVIEGEIKVFSKDDQKLLLTLTTDTTGSFVFDPVTLGLAQPADLLIVLDADPGHRAEWHVSSDSYALSADQSAPQVSKTPDLNVPDTPLPSTPTLGSVVIGILAILGLGALIRWSRFRRRNQR